MSLNSIERTPGQRRKDRLLAGAMAAVFAFMLGLTFASAELYDLFCRATGYNGTTKVAKSAPAQSLERKVKVRFDANVMPGLPWRFEAETAEIELRLGEVAEITYSVRNLSERDTVGIASYNVQPEITGSYFNKIQCFCFTEQLLKPGEIRKETVVFFVDPAMISDRDAERAQVITLSYTFSAVKLPPKPLAAVGSAAKLQ